MRPSYRRILVIWFSLLVLTIGLALSALAFHGARTSTTPLAHALFQEVSDHAVTKTRDFLGRAEPALRAYPDRRHVRWANAGHDPAILYDPHTGRFDEVGYDGIPLGIETPAEFTERTFGPLRPGHVVVLGTDGIWDTVNPANEFYGKDRVREIVRARATDSAEQIATAIRQDLDAFRARGHQRDDVTLVVIKILGDDSDPPASARPRRIEDPALPVR